MHSRISFKLMYEGVPLEKLRKLPPGENIYAEFVSRSLYCGRNEVAKEEALKIVNEQFSDKTKKGAFAIFNYINGLHAQEESHFADAIACFAKVVESGASNTITAAAREMAWTYKAQGKLKECYAWLAKAIIQDGNGATRAQKDFVELSGGDVDYMVQIKSNAFISVVLSGIKFSKPFLDSYLKHSDADTVKIYTDANDIAATVEAAPASIDDANSAIARITLGRIKDDQYIFFNYFHYCIRNKIISSDVYIKVINFFLRHATDPRLKNKARYSLFKLHVENKNFDEAYKCLAEISATFTKYLWADFEDLPDDKRNLAAYSAVKKMIQTRQFDAAYELARNIDDVKVFDEDLLTMLQCMKQDFDSFKYKKRIITRLHEVILEDEKSFAPAFVAAVKKMYESSEMSAYPFVMRKSVGAFEKYINERDERKKLSKLMRLSDTLLSEDKNRRAFLSKLKELALKDDGKTFNAFVDAVHESENKFTGRTVTGAFSQEERDKAARGEFKEMGKVFCLVEDMIAAVRLHAREHEEELPMRPRCFDNLETGFERSTLADLLMADDDLHAKAEFLLRSQYFNKRAPIDIVAASITFADISSEVQKNNFMLYFSGVKAERENRFTEAQRYYEQAAMLDAPYAAVPILATCALAKLHIRQNRIEETIPLFIKVALKEPANVDAILMTKKAKTYYYFVKLLISSSQNLKFTVELKSQLMNHPGEFEKVLEACIKQSQVDRQVCENLLIQIVNDKTIFNTNLLDRANFALSVLCLDRDDLVKAQQYREQITQSFKGNSSLDARFVKARAQVKASVPAYPVLEPVPVTPSTDSIFIYPDVGQDRSEIKKIDESERWLMDFNSHPARVSASTAVSVQDEPVQARVPTVDDLLMRELEALPAPSNTINMNAFFKPEVVNKPEPEKVSDKRRLLVPAGN